MTAAKTKKNKRETYHVWDPMFKAGVTLLLNCSFDECVDYVKENNYNFVGGDEDLDSFRNSLGVCFSLRQDGDSEDNRVYMIWQRNFTWTVPDIGVLVHELLHFSVIVLDDKGIAVRPENDEVLAYFHEWFVTELFKQIAPKNKKATPKGRPPRKKKS